MFVYLLVCLFVGAGMYLKTKNPDIQVVLADPQVSYGKPAIMDIF